MSTPDEPKTSPSITTRPAFCARTAGARVIADAVTHAYEATVDAIADDSDLDLIRHTEAFQQLRDGFAGVWRDANLPPRQLLDLDLDLARVDDAIAGLRPQVHRP